MPFQTFVDTDLIYRISGLVGFFLYLSSFAALQFKWLDGQGLTYSLMNIAAAALVLISLTNEFNLASALIQISWIVIGCAGLLLRIKTHKPRQQTRPVSV